MLQLGTVVMVALSPLVFSTESTGCAAPLSPLDDEDLSRFEVLAHTDRVALAPLRNVHPSQRAALSHFLDRSEGGAR